MFVFFAFCLSALLLPLAPTTWHLKHNVITSHYDLVAYPRVIISPPGRQLLLLIAELFDVSYALSFHLHFSFLPFLPK
jgi:hypothetical protein